MKSVLIINLDVKDNHEEAAIGAKLALDLCQEVCGACIWTYEHMIEIGLVLSY